MKFKDFMSRYYNWETDLVVNDDSLNLIVKGKVRSIMECKVMFNLQTHVKNYMALFEMEVVSFDFYDNTLYVRVR